MKSARSGTYVKQTGGFRAFIPNDLPFSPPLQLDPSLEETTGQSRNRLYSYEPYRALLR